MIKFKELKAIMTQFRLPRTLLFSSCFTSKTGLFIARIETRVGRVMGRATHRDEKQAFMLACERAVEQLNRDKERRLP